MRFLNSRASGLSLLLLPVFLVGRWSVRRRFFVDLFEGAVEMTVVMENIPRNCHSIVKEQIPPCK